MTTRRSRKLQLKRETIKALGAADLRQVGGGGSALCAGQKGVLAPSMTDGAVHF